MSLKTQYNFPIRKRNSLNNNSENSGPSPKSTGVKRALFGKANPDASPKKARISDENTIIDRLKSEKFPTKTDSTLSKVKQVFHTRLPTRLVGRSKEMSEIHCFLSDHISNKKPGSLYLSGAPGTGKTSCLMFVKKGIEAAFSFAFINCMTVNTPTAIYRAISKELGLSAKAINSKNIAQVLKNHILNSKTMNVLVLDEIDHLDTKGQQVLYSLFEWPHMPNSSLVLIGIANSLDLTDRMLPLLNTFKFQPKLMHFLPYTKDQIVTILEDRLSEAQTDGTLVISPMAVQLCARKIAANTGDIRKALDVCRRAIEIVENRLTRQPTLQATSDDRCNPGSPMKRSSIIQKVDVQEISSVLSEVYGSRLQVTNSSAGSTTVTLPLNQMLLLCTVVLMKKHCKTQDMTLGKAYDVCKRICKKRDITFVDECSFQSLCKLVESRGFVQLKMSQVPRLTKISLKMDDGEVELVLQDKAMLPSILADTTVLYK
ncbi:cell division control protein 6 homolog [Parasteatoda tepidariorum]|uniref:cell division control protein 6 homolog n=1 Tax=Parasteatoda tepidariorum TaxID=114398 RepID=UPI00077FC4FA|nr:cell division control protein 6 homolog [Parasteatoda tepidariorum]